LPARQRIVITLRDLEGYTADEVCLILDISAANQRVLLHRARATVRAELEAYFASSGETAPERIEG
jgi:RNA polymerase sigma-70 factor (ECF subfamily)